MAEEGMPLVALLKRNILDCEINRLKLFVYLLEYQEMVRRDT